MEPRPLAIYHERTLVPDKLAHDATLAIGHRNSQQTANAAYLPQLAGLFSRDNSTLCAQRCAQIIQTDQELR